MIIEQLTMIDWLLIILIVYSTLVGIKKGAVEEFITLTVWVIAAYMAYNYTGWFASQLNFLDEYALGITIRILFAAVVLIALVLVIGVAIRALIRLFVRGLGIGKVDSILGACFGFLRGFVIAVIVVSHLPIFLMVDQYYWWQQSILVPKLVLFAEDTAQFIQSLLGKF